MVAERLSDILQGPKPKAEAPLTDVEGESAGPCGWVNARGCRALDVERGSEAVVTLQYVYLAVLSEFSPGKFWVVFSGLQSWKVSVEGRNLRYLYDRLNDHCLRRIRKADRDFGEEDGKPFVTGLKVEEVTPARE